MANLPETIRTLYQPNPQKPEIVLTTKPLPTIAPNSTEHLIRVHATSPCAGEPYWPKYFGEMFGPEIVPCYDLSGTVVAAPDNSPFPVGTEVWSRSSVDHPGNAREYTIAYEKELWVRPTSLGAVEAASVPLSVETAVQVLFEKGGIAGLDKGEEGRKANASKRILVIAASGGVGVWLLQMAREAGVGSIVGVCSTANVELVKSLGATDVIDYRKQSISDHVGQDESRKFDLIADGKGGDSLAQAWNSVKDGGKLLSIVEPPEGRKPEGCKAKDVENYFFVMEPRGSDLKDVTRLFDEGKVRTVVDSVFPLDQYQAAFDKLAGGHATGKILIKI